MLDNKKQHLYILDNASDADMIESEFNISSDFENASLAGLLNLCGIWVS